MDNLIVFEYPNRAVVSSKRGVNRKREVEIFRSEKVELGPKRTGESRP